MINKIANSVADALAGVADGSTVLIGGFGTAGIPNELIDGLIEQGARDLTVVNNNAGNGDSGLAALLKSGRVRKVICSFPRQTDSHVFDALYRSGKIELELVPQGNLAERLRAAGAGIGAFFTPTGYGTELARGPDGQPTGASGAQVTFTFFGVKSEKRFAEIVAENNGAIPASMLREGEAAPTTEEGKAALRDRLLDLYHGKTHVATVVGDTDSSATGR